jgi:hypothetical protein
VTSTWSIIRSSPSKNSFSAAASVASRAAVWRTDVGRRLAEPFGTATDEDDVGPLGPGPARGLQPDARAAADQDDGLPGQFVGHFATSVRSAFTAVS